MTEDKLDLEPAWATESKCRTMLTSKLSASDRRSWLGWLLLCAPLLGLLLYGSAIQADDSFPVFTGFQEVEGLYEPSAAEQMPDGRIFVVEDEVAHSVAILTIREDGTFDVERLKPKHFFKPVSEDGIPEDFEGSATDNDGYVYITTSHSRETDGKAYPHREKLIRFKMEGNEAVEMAVYGDLVADILAAHPDALESLRAINVKEENGFNIEGIAFDRNKEKLLIGFRSPQDYGKAVLLTVENVKDMFEQGSKAVIGEESVVLDLKDSGVRGMAYIPKLDGYLIISGPTSRDRSINFGLWFWSGKSEDQAVKVSIPGPDNAINLTECVSPIQFAGKELVLLVRDDGKKKKKSTRNAHYMFLTYEQLKFDGQ